MKGQLCVEVEPLSEQRWAKIERSLVARLEAEPRPQGGRSEPQRGHLGGRMWWLAAAAVTALVVLFVGVRWFPERVNVDHPSRITTGENASHLALAGLTLDVEPQSAVVLSAETQQGMLLVLDRGSIVCEVAPRAHDAPLIVQAGAARVRVVGTRFKVTRSGEGASVAVYHGVVEVTSAGQTKRVVAGEVWPSQKDSANPVRSSSLEENDPNANAAPTGSGSSELADTDGSRRTPRASSVRPKSSPSERAVSGSGNSERSGSNDGVSADEPQPTPRRSPQAVFEQATALELSDPVRASQLYRSLESGSDSWAQNALYAHGRLEASRGNRAGARRLLERYLERFPRGGNAADARAVLRRLE